MRVRLNRFLDRFLAGLVDMSYFRDDLLPGIEKLVERMILRLQLVSRRSHIAIALESFPNEKNDVWACRAMAGARLGEAILGGHEHLVGSTPNRFLLAPSDDCSARTKVDARRAICKGHQGVGTGAHLLLDYDSEGLWEF